VVLPPVSNTPYFAQVQKNRDIDVEVAARLAEMPVDEFKALNPSFNRPVIRGEHASMILPADRVAVFNANMENFKGQLSSWKVYQPRRGDTYASIAKSFGIAESTLRDINDIPSRQKRVAMAHLLVPSRGGVQLASLNNAGGGAGRPEPPRAGSVRSATAHVASAKMNAPRPNVRQHKVKPGDTLYSLARQYSTTVDALRALNNLKGNGLKVGSTLRVPGTNVRG
jgi:membrane-bound lytic murein transglycosylase D